MTDLPTPERLRAAAASWSLRASLTLLVDRSDQEDRAIADERVAAADPIKSPIYGARLAFGGHGDPTSDALLLLDDPPRSNPYTDLVDEVAAQLAGVAQHLPVPMRDVTVNGVTTRCLVMGADSLDCIQAAIPAMSKTAGIATWRLLDRIDGRIRRRLNERPDQQHLPRVRCPWCDAVSLTMRLAPPRNARVVECTTCDGAWPWTEMTGNGARA